MVKITALSNKTEIISPPKIVSTEGKILWQDDVEGTLKWNNGTKDTSNCRVFGGSAVLKITSAGAAAWTTDCYSKILVNRPEIINSKLGLEMYVHLTKVDAGAGGMDLFYVYCDIYDGTNKNSFGWAYEPTGTLLQYHDSTGGLTSTGQTIILVPDYYFRVKIVVDLKTGKYIRLECGTKVIDLSTIAIQQVASTNQVGEMHIKLTGINATTCDAYIDNITITYDEP